MFGLEYVLAFIKLFFNLAFAIVSALFFKPAWNCVAANYLVEWLPEQFLYIPYWHFVAIIMTCTFLGEQIAKLTPKIISVNNSNDNSSKDVAKKK